METIAAARVPAPYVLGRPLHRTSFTSVKIFSPRWCPSRELSGRASSSLRVKASIPRAAVASMTTRWASEGMAGMNLRSTKSSFFQGSHALGGNQTRPCHVRLVPRAAGPIRSGISDMAAHVISTATQFSLSHNQSLGGILEAAGGAQQSLADVLSASILAVTGGGGNSTEAYAAAAPALEQLQLGASAVAGAGLLGAVAGAAAGAAAVALVTAGLSSRRKNTAAAAAARKRKREDPEEEGAGPNGPASDAAAAAAAGTPQRSKGALEGGAGSSSSPGGRGGGGDGADSWPPPPSTALQLTAGPRDVVVMSNPSAFNQFVRARCPSLPPVAGSPCPPPGAVKSPPGSGWRGQGAPRPAMQYQRQCVIAQDGGAIALDWPATLDLAAESGLEPTLLLVAGTTQGSAEPGLAAMVELALARGFFPVVLNPRGCGNSPLTTPRLFSAADSADVHLAARCLAQKRPSSPVVAAGWGLGASMLVRHLGEAGLESHLAAAVSLGNPFDLQLAADSLERPRNEAANWAATAGMAAILERHQMLFQGASGPQVDVSAGMKARTAREFDAAVTSVSRGFARLEDYYEAASCGPYVAGIKTPLLCVQAADDPLAPLLGVPREGIVANPCVTLVVAMDAEDAGSSSSCSGSKLQRVGREELGSASPARWNFDLILEWLGAVELALLKGKHPLAASSRLPPAQHQERIPQAAWRGGGQGAAPGVLPLAGGGTTRSTPLEVAEEDDWATREEQEEEAQDLLHRAEALSWASYDEEEGDSWREQQPAPPPQKRPRGSGSPQPLVPVSVATGAGRRRGEGGEDELGDVEMPDVAAGSEESLGARLHRDPPGGSRGEGSFHRHDAGVEGLPDSWQSAEDGGWQRGGQDEVEPPAKAASSDASSAGAAATRRRRQGQRHLEEASGVQEEVAALRDGVDQVADELPPAGPEGGPEAKAGQGAAAGAGEGAGAGPGVAASEQAPAGPTREATAGAEAETGGGPGVGAGAGGGGGGGGGGAGAGEEAAVVAAAAAPEAVPEEVVEPEDAQQARAAAQSVLNALDITMPGALSPARKQQVVEAVGRGKSTMTALQEAVPPDVREKMTAAVAEAAKAKDLSISLLTGKGLPVPPPLAPPPAAPPAAPAPASAPPSATALAAAAPTAAPPPTSPPPPSPAAADASPTAQAAPPAPAPAAEAAAAAAAAPAAKARGGGAAEGGSSKATEGASKASDSSSGAVASKLDGNAGGADADAGLAADSVKVSAGADQGAAAGAKEGSPSSAASGDASAPPSPAPAAAATAEPAAAAAAPAAAKEGAAGGEVKSEGGGEQAQPPPPPAPETAGASSAAAPAAAAATAAAAAAPAAPPAAPPAPAPAAPPPPPPPAPPAVPVKSSLNVRSALDTLAGFDDSTQMAVTNVLGVMDSMLSSLEAKQALADSESGKKPEKGEEGKQSEAAAADATREEKEEAKVQMAAKEEGGKAPRGDAVEGAAGDGGAAAGTASGGLQEPRRAPVGSPSSDDTGEQEARDKGKPSSGAGPPESVPKQGGEATHESAHPAGPRRAQGADGAREGQATHVGGGGNGITGGPHDNLAGAGELPSGTGSARGEAGGTKQGGRSGAGGQGGGSSAADDARSPSSSSSSTAGVRPSASPAEQRRLAGNPAAASGSTTAATTASGPGRAQSSSGRGAALLEATPGQAGPAAGFRAGGAGPQSALPRRASNNPNGTPGVGETAVKGDMVCLDGHLATAVNGCATLSGGAVSGNGSARGGSAPLAGPNGSPLPEAAAPGGLPAGGQWRDAEGGSAYVGPVHSPGGAASQENGSLGGRGGGPSSRRSAQRGRGGGAGEIGGGDGRRAAEPQVEASEGRAGRAGAALRQNGAASSSGRDRVHNGAANVRRLESSADGGGNGRERGSESGSGSGNGADRAAHSNRKRERPGADKAAAGDEGNGSPKKLQVRVVETLPWEEEAPTTMSAAEAGGQLLATKKPEAAEPKMEPSTQGATSTGERGGGGASPLSPSSSPSPGMPAAAAAAGPAPPAELPREEAGSKARGRVVVTESDFESIKQEADVKVGDEREAQSAARGGAPQHRSCREGAGADGDGEVVDEVCEVEDECKAEPGSGRGEQHAEGEGGDSRVAGLVMSALQLELGRRLGAAGLEAAGVDLEEEMGKVASAVAGAVGKARALTKGGAVDSTSPPAAGGGGGGFNAGSVMEAVGTVMGGLQVLPGLLPLGVLGGVIVAALGAIFFAVKDDIEEEEREEKDRERASEGEGEGGGDGEAGEAVGAHGAVSASEGEGAPALALAEEEAEVGSVVEISTASVGEEQGIAEGAKKDDARPVEASGGAAGAGVDNGDSGGGSGSDSGDDAQPMSKSERSGQHMMSVMAASVGATAALGGTCAEMLEESSEETRQLGKAGEGEAWGQGGPEEGGGGSSDGDVGGGERQEGGGGEEQHDGGEGGGGAIHQLGGLAEKAMNAAAPVIPKNEAGEIDHNRLVTMLAELGQRGGMLRLVGKVALLWGGLRGAMGLAERLLALLRVSERPLLQRLGGFLVMGLLLWTPVLVPLLPTLLQTWATKSPAGGVVECALAVGLYGALFILVRIWGAKVRGYGDQKPLKGYGLRLFSRKKIILLLGGQALSMGLVGALYAAQVALQLATFHPPQLPALAHHPDILAYAAAAALAVWKATHIVGEALGVGLATAVVEELLFRAWLQEEARPDLGFHGAALFSAVIFAVVHWSPPAIPGLVLLSLALTGARERTRGNLALPIGLHSGLVAGNLLVHRGALVRSVGQNRNWLTGAHVHNPLAGALGVGLISILVLALYPWGKNVSLSVARPDAGDPIDVAKEGSVEECDDGGGSGMRGAVA